MRRRTGRAEPAPATTTRPLATKTVTPAPVAATRHEAKTPSSAAPAQGPVPAPAEAVPASAPATPAQAGQEEDLAAVLARATGSTDLALSTVLISDAVGSTGLRPGQQHHDGRLRAVSSLMKEFGPRDGVEGALAASFAALHTNALQLLRRAADAELPHEVAGRLRRDAVALLRTANEIVGAVQERRGRTTHQRVVVERVVVQEGGQAIVGTVAGGGPNGH